MFKKNWQSWMVMAVAAVAFAACGVQEDTVHPSDDDAADAGSDDAGSDDAGNDAGTDAGTTTTVTNTDVLKASGCQILLSTKYVGGSITAAVVGELHLGPNTSTSWSSGPAAVDGNGDGYLEWNPDTTKVESGFIQKFTYMAGTMYADYGNRADFKANIKAMSDSARQSLYCDWWNGSSDNGSGGCKLQGHFTVSGSSCTWTGDGNMLSYR